jgi:hypothetical protein
VAKGEERRELGRPGRPRSGKGEAKVDVLQVRFQEAELAQLREAASADFLELATWARQLLLKAVQARRTGTAEPDSRFLRQLDLTSEEWARVHEAATAEHLDDFAWIRQQVMRAVDARKTLLANKDQPKP